MIKQYLKNWVEINLNFNLIDHLKEIEQLLVKIFYSNCYNYFFHQTQVTSRQT